MEDGVSVEGDPFVFEEFNVYLARLLPHADAAKESGDGAVAGVAVGCDPVSICGGEEVIKHSFEYFGGLTLVLARGREGDSDFEGVGQVGQGMNSHVALQFPGAEIMNGELKPSSTIRKVGRRLGRDQLRCFHVAVGRLPSLPASNIRILPVGNESGRIIGAERGDGQSGRRQWVGHRMKCSR